MAGCQSKKPAMPGNTPTPLVSSCLGDFRMDDLELMVERCDEAIEQTPDQADLHRDRALVLTLLGDQAKACDDVAIAVSLLKRVKPAGRPDAAARTPGASEQLQTIPHHGGE